MDSQCVSFTNHVCTTSIFSWHRNLGPPASTPPPFHCLCKHSLYNIISFSSTFKIQEILFSLQTCTFLKKRRFSEDVVFQKTTSRLHGRYQISALAEFTAHARQVHRGQIASESLQVQLATYRSWGFVVTNSFLLADDANCAINEERRVCHSEVPARGCGQLKAF